MNIRRLQKTFTRREFMATAAAGIAAVSVAAQESKNKESKNDEGWIDAHSHIWTPDVEHYPLAKGQTKKDLAPPSFTPEELFKLTGPVNVKRVVLIGHHTYYGYDNRYLIDSAAKYPDAFRVVALLDEMDGDPSSKMRKLLEQRVTGFRITPLIRGDKWLDSEGMHAMWRCGAETRQAMCCLTNPENLPQIDKMCEQHADTPVVIDHFARIGMDGEFREKDLDALCKLAEHPHVHVKISAYYALGQKSPPYLDLVPMIRRLYETFGAKRLMWASDSPYQLAPPNTYQASIDLVEKKLDFVSADDRRWLLRETAKAVYFFR